MASTSSALRVLVMWIFVPVRTKQARTAMTRNIKVKTWTSGALLVSVMILCVEFMLGDVAEDKATWT